MSREAGELTSPRAPADLKDRILQRLHDGERVILPVADPARPALPGRRIAAAFAATVSVAIAASIFSAREAASEASDLTYSPSQPEMGDVVEFEYNATSAFVGEDTLILRAVYRRPEDGSTWHEDLPPAAVGALVAAEDGVYRTSVPLPPDVVYASFAVEDRHGNRVDSKGLAAWELLVHENGKPTYDALMQKYSDMSLRNWELARATAGQTTVLYPDRPGGWYGLAVLQSSFYGEADFDSRLLPQHRSIFARLENALERQGTLSGADLSGMYWYARSLGDAAAAREWADRMLEEVPDDAFARDIRVQQAYEPDGPHPTLDRFEELWAEGGFEHSGLVSLGFRTALATDDTVLIDRWLHRTVQFQPSQAEDAARRLASKPSDFARRSLQFLADQVVSPGTVHRSLFHTATEHRQQLEERRLTLVATLGRMLLAQGETSAGLGCVVPIIDRSWDVELFSTTADVMAGLGQTKQAFEYLARTAVDPWTSTAIADSLEERAHAALYPGEWEMMLEGAKAQMARHFLRDVSPLRFVEADLQVEDANGNVRNLTEVMADRISIIAFWSGNDLVAVQDLDPLIEIHDRVRDYDAQLLTITQHQISADSVMYFSAGHDLPFPVYRDVSSNVQRWFNVWGAPEYFVVDASGSVKFSFSEVDDLLNQVAALHYESGRAATSLVTEEDSRPQ
jgi:hypothetical protein